MTRPHPVPFMLAVACAGLLACDCEPVPDNPGNQDPDSLAACPELPPGVTPIEGLAVAHASDRFDGLVVTLSSRPLACGEPAAQHGYCPSTDDRGLTLGFPGPQATLGVYPLGDPLYVEFETPDLLLTGGGGDLDEAQVEIFAITDECVTGRIVGLVAKDGPFEGGFRAPRCTP